MPQTYMRTWPGSIGVKVSVARVSVLWMRRVMGRRRFASRRVARARQLSQRCVPYNRIQYSGPSPSAEHRVRDAVRRPHCPTMHFRMLAAVRLLCAGLRARAGRRRSRIAEELSEVDAAASRRPDAAAALERADRVLAGQAEGCADALPEVGGARRVRPRRRGARRCCSSSSQDYPELAEPYNNLAVLHAAAGDYGKARAALEAAMRLNPQLRDRARESRRRATRCSRPQSYARAPRLEPASADLPRKLALVRQLAWSASRRRARGQRAGCLCADRH